ncbi:hypothetical protein AC1031_007085 [Aphanomyces cochlioides]|nr:hypothetical protein AC1031_007085 [Aphanomyces cochlioides]
MAVAQAVSKRFLNVWNFVVLILGFGLLLITLYILIFQSDTYAIPKAGYWAAEICAGLLILLSGLGLYGLRQQRVCVTHNKRNYALGIYCLIGFACGVVLVVAGSVALTFNSVIYTSKELELIESAEIYFEEAMIDNLNDFATEEPEKWKQMQDNWFCCGYYDIPNVTECARRVTNKLDGVTLCSKIDIPYIAMANTINSIHGVYCSTNCTDGQTVCPQTNTDWCRDVFLNNAQTNTIFVGWVSVTSGGAQLLGILLGMFILLCDVRMIRRFTMRASALKNAIENNQA